MAEGEKAWKKAPRGPPQRGNNVGKKREAPGEKKTGFDENSLPKKR